jgi:hypothetical protein
MAESATTLMVKRSMVRARRRWKDGQVNWLLCGSQEFSGIIGLRGKGKKPRLIGRTASQGERHASFDCRFQSRVFESPAVLPGPPSTQGGSHQRWAPMQPVLPIVPPAGIVLEMDRQWSGKHNGNLFQHFLPDLRASLTCGR